MTEIPDDSRWPSADWAGLRTAFRWRLPARFNLAEAMVGRWAAQDPSRPALIQIAPEGVRRYSYGDLDRASCRLANWLQDRGVGRRDRVAVLLPQSAEVLLTHLACARIGAITVPLFTLFGPDALAYRLADSGARVLITDRTNAPKLASIRAELPALETVVATDGATDGAEALTPLLDRSKDDHTPLATSPEDPAFISYTSGTTGPPKGVLHAQRVLLGHLPGVQLAHERLPQPGDCLWTPADWAWMGGLCNIAMPALYFGRPLVAHRFDRFDPERAFALMAEHGVRNVFLPPTALKLMRAVPNPQRFGHALRSVASGGESLGAELLDWGHAAFGLTINEFYGQTECNLVVGNCSTLAAVRPDYMGRAYPGSEVAILDPDGSPSQPGQTGDIAIRRGDAAMFLEYWNKPEKTAEKFRGDWMLTGDEGEMDADGYLRFAARTDDVITSSGYRIGPTEIEHCLVGHPAVAMAAVIGVPDPVRTEAVTAFVTLAQGSSGGTDLATTLIEHVRTRLSPHLAPRAVHVIDEMPMTSTGKILRRALRPDG
ncbi:MAG: AMP-binding protein [Pseudomonadota bacterium]